MKLSDRFRALGVALLLAATLASPPTYAQMRLSPDLAPLQFLVGQWIGDDGHAEGGQTARGTSTIESAAAGTALLRRDRTQLLSAAGQVTHSFEQIMLIYPQEGHLRADYFDGTHAIHYTDIATVPAGRIVFTSAAGPTSPAFRLTYAKKGAAGLSIRFEVCPSGQRQCRVIAEGTAHRAA